MKLLIWLTNGTCLLREYEHFQKKPGWKISPVVPFVGVGVAAVYFTNRQEVPYTKRQAA